MQKEYVPLFGADIDDTVQSYPPRQKTKTGYNLRIINRIIARMGKTLGLWSVLLMCAALSAHTFA